MIVLALALLLALQQPAPQEPPPSPVVRLSIHPADLAVAVGDTMRLRVIPLDAAGRPVENASVRFSPAGAWFEGSVDRRGLVRAGSTGTLPVGISVIVPGARPFAQRIEVRMVAGPASRVEIMPAPARLAQGQRVRLTARVLSAAGDERGDAVAWSSSDGSVARVTPEGLVTARSAGRATLRATAGEAAGEVRVEVVGSPVARVEIVPARVEARQGDVLRFRALARDASGREIPGLMAAWSFSPGQGLIRGDGAFVGYEAGEYLVTASFGGASADAVVTLSGRGVRRPLSVVGRLPRTAFTTEEVWLHPTAPVAYLGTGSGGDRLYVVDVSDPARPFVADSLLSDTRRVNDNMTTPDGRYLIHTREGASSRRNGIVIASLEDPRRPRPIAEFTEGLTAGVHSAFVHSHPQYGTHVYATNNGTNALHIIDLNDPHAPRTAAIWRSPSANAGGALHDVDVQDGLAYLSNWNDGLIILDVGNGIRGGSPASPQFVSRFRYDLDQLYRNAEAEGGPGFIRGTHTAWRHRDYVFIADEVFPAAPVRGARDAAAGRAYGRLQVIDVADIFNPRSVAWYEPEYGGVHNLWVDGERLYLGAYNGGFRVFDVSGELLGDLRAQRREIGHLDTADMDGYVKNAAMTWGVVVRDGLAYVNDMYNGLWIVGVEESVRSELGR